jgi:hypothetical protein
MIKITYGRGKPVTSYAQAYQAAVALLTDNPHNWVRIKNADSDYNLVLHTHPDLTIHRFSEGPTTQVDVDLRAMESHDRDHPPLPEDRQF